MNGDQSREVDRGQGFERPWLYYVFMTPALAAVFIVVGISIYYYFQGYCSFASCMDMVPYWHNIKWLIFIAFLAKWIDRWRKSRPLFGP